MYLIFPTTKKAVMYKMTAFNFLLQNLNA